MAFCRQCGSKLVDGSKFCEKCGCPVLRQTDKHSGSGERQQEYVGKIYKCPNCGEVLKSFTRTCPACGFELRGAKATSAVKEFALKLEAIESRREYEPSMDSLSKTDEQKISLIKNFSVPNTTEDMLEFMILATSNVNIDIYNAHKQSYLSKAEKSVSNAWASKIEQVYNKSKVSHGEEEIFQQIQSLYDGFNSKVRKSKKVGTVSNIISKYRMHIILFGLLATLFVVLSVQVPDDGRKEIARLEAIEQEVTQALENGEYKRALLTAKGLEYTGSPASAKSLGLGSYNDVVRQWDITRELLIDKILEEAAAHGVNLDYDPPTDESEKPDNSAEPSDGNSTGLVSGFVDGFVKGYHEAADPGIDAAESRIAAAKDQIDAAMGTNNHEGP